MTTTAPPLTGREINLAARATRLLLASRLDRIDLTFEQSIVLNLIGTGQATSERAVREQLSATLDLDDPTIDDLLGGLATDGLVERDGPTGVLRLGSDGDRRWHQYQDVVAEVVGSLYAGLDPDDLATTRRVLVEVTERAEAHLRA